MSNPLLPARPQPTTYTRRPLKAIQQAAVHKIWLEGHPVGMVSFEHTATDSEKWIAEVAIVVNEHTGELQKFPKEEAPDASPQTALALFVEHGRKL